MADNVAMKDVQGNAFNASTKQLADQSQSPKTTILKADGSVADPLSTTDFGVQADAAVTDPAASATLIALIKGWLTGQGQKADAAVTDPTASASMIAALKGNLTLMGVAGNSPPALATNAVGIIGWLRKLTDVLLGTIAVISTDVTASGNITTQNLAATGTATANSAVVLSLNGATRVAFQLSGTWTCSDVRLYATVDGTTWVNILNVMQLSTNKFGTGYSSNGIYVAQVAGFAKVRVSANTAVTGTLVAALRASLGGTNDINIAQLGGNNVSGNLGVTANKTTGNVAHSSAASGNPVRVAGKVATSVDTTLAAGDVSDQFMTTGGAAVVKPYAVPEVDFTYTGVITTTTQTAAKAAGASGIKNYVTGIQYQNNNATVTTILIQDGNTTIAQFNCPANMVLPANLTFPTPLRTSANAALNVTMGTTGASVQVNIQGYQAP